MRVTRESVLFEETNGNDSSCPFGRGAQPGRRQAGISRMCCASPVEPKGLEEKSVFHGDGPRMRLALRGALTYKIESTSDNAQMHR